MSMHCPDCDSTLFHINEDAQGKQFLHCHRTKSCGWSVQLKPPVPLSSRKKRIGRLKSNMALAKNPPTT
jgi:hypothetical protein